MAKLTQAEIKMLKKTAKEEKMDEKEDMMEEMDKSCNCEQCKKARNGGK